MGMQPLREAEREAVVVRFLSEYHKVLPSEMVKNIADDPKCSHPLFLRTLLEELRLFGSHEWIERHLGRLLECTGTEDLFQRVLERMEDDYSQRVVREVMSFLWGSRFGLTEDELAELTEISRLKLATLLLGLDYHLVRRDGLLGFFHDYLRRAVEKRYLSDEPNQLRVHLELAGYFEKVLTGSGGEGDQLSSSLNFSKTGGIRRHQELAWQLYEAVEFERLADLLSTIDHFMLLYQGETRDDVLRYWALLGEDHDIERAYQRGLQQWRARTDTVQKKMMVISRVADLLNKVGRWDAAVQLQQERLELAIRCEDQTEEANARRSLGDLHRMKGEHAEAFGELERAQALYEKYGNRRGISSTVGAIGLVNFNLGEYDKALQCFHQQEAICREIDDRGSLSKAIGNMGLTYHNRAEYDRALECYRQQEAICHEIGDRYDLSIAVGNMGNVFYARGALDRALECYRQQEAICRELGNRARLATVLGNIANVLSDRCEYDRALKYYQQQEAICREIGDRRELSIVLGSMAILYIDLGDYDRALEYYRQEEKVCREIDNRDQLAHALGNMGVLHRRRGEYDHALECYRQAELIYRELGDRRGLMYAIGNPATVYINRGEYGQALVSITEALAGHREIGHLVGVAIWLADRASVLMELTALEVKMPVYLTEFVSGATESTWRRLALQIAGESVRECAEIAMQLQRPDKLFESQLLLARFDAAEGRLDVALQGLTAMLNDAANDQQSAELHYWLWRISRAAEKEGRIEEIEVHRVEALQLYEALYVKTPMDNYRTRIEELRAAASTSETTNATT
jgi:tetratricopeptide (TPR) repeat protein